MELQSRSLQHNSMTPMPARMQLVHRACVCINWHSVKGQPGCENVKATGHSLSWAGDPSPGKGWPLLSCLKQRRNLYLFLKRVVMIYQNTFILIKFCCTEGWDHPLPGLNVWQCPSICAAKLLWALMDFNALCTEITPNEEHWPHEPHTGLLRIRGNGGQLEVECVEVIYLCHAFGIIATDVRSAAQVIGVGHRYWRNLFGLGISSVGLRSQMLRMSKA